MAKSSKVVLFEDDPSVAPAVIKAVKKFLAPGFKLVRFPLDERGSVAAQPYEDALQELLSTPVYENTVLLVTDRDLSASKWGGLSEAAISRVGRSMGLPVAWYAQRIRSGHEILTRIPGDGRIGLSEKPEELGREVAVIAKGFTELERAVAKHQASGASRPKSPGELLAGILGEPAAASHLDAYASGDQGVVAEILQTQGKDRRGKVNQRRHLTAALGVWIADVVLRFPGVLLGTKAAASYLDIHLNDFEKPKTQRIFKGALWTDAPFVDTQEPRWWKVRLDRLLSENRVQFGRELVEKKLGRRPRFCPCSVDRKVHAGYFCMVSKEPVSAKNSVGPISWFPPGAELARISKPIFEKIAPWVGA